MKNPYRYKPYSDERHDIASCALVYGLLMLRDNKLSEREGLVLSYHIVMNAPKGIN
ncbi:MAG: hypothetical protein ACRD3D_00985 [Terriglobia bacterium]